MFDKKALLSIIQGNVMSFPQLARKMSVPRNKNREFSTFLFGLVKEGTLFTTFEREYFVPKLTSGVEGIIRINARGFGFVDREDLPSIFVAAPNVNSAMDGDSVVMDIFDDPSKKDSVQGIVKGITNRARTEFVGRLRKFGTRFGIIPIDPKINGVFSFEDESELKVDFEAKVRIVEFGKTRKLELVYLLGHKDDVSIDILASIEDAGVPYTFDPQTMAQANKVAPTIDNEDKTGRTDIRDRMIVTIDGDDTKDFDDAIEITKLDNGNFMLGVHIADVTHYVKEDSPMDDEAKRRGTSIYLADRVIPMLPEALSNGICSLNPHVDRFVLSCEMEINQAGETVNYKMYPGIINSKHRLTYKEVNEFYDGNKEYEDKDLIKTLQDAQELSKIIRKFKLKQGYIDFEIDESKIIIDENGKTKDIVLRDRGFSEMMIEDFMVRANETVAYSAFSKELPFIYRIHDKPDAERLTSLQGVLDILGLNIKIDLSTDPKRFANSIAQLKLQRFDDFIKIMMLRTMAKAIYSSNNIGHFGLASETYTHFTSPIRRYPDLMVHRMIRTYFFEGKLDQASHFKQILPGISSASSLSEQKAVELERHIADIKKAEFYEGMIGKEFKGTIVTVTKFGFFVELTNKVAGLVHVSNLMDGMYKLDHTGFKLVGPRKFVVGQSIDVVVIGANKKEGAIDFAVADQYEIWKKAKGEK